MTTRQQLDSFHRFALEQIECSGANLSIDDLYEVWRASDSTVRERIETVAWSNFCEESKTNSALPVTIPDS